MNAKCTSLNGYSTLNVSGTDEEMLSLRLMLECLYSDLDNEREVRDILFSAITTELKNK